MAKLLMILNDGTTFTDLKGCKMISVPDNWDTDRVEEALGNQGIEDEPNLIVLCEFN